MKTTFILLLSFVLISSAQDNKLGYDIVCEFENGIARIKKDNLWGYIDTTGFSFIKPQYKAVSRFKNKKALVVLNDGKKIIINKNGDHLTIFDDNPKIKKNFILELPMPVSEKNFESYVSHFLIDSNSIEYDFYNCIEGEGSGGESFRLLKYGIVNKNTFGYDDSNKKYLIPNYSIDKAISLLKILTTGQEYKISKRGDVIEFMSKKNWITDYYIQQVSPQVISIAVDTSI